MPVTVPQPILFGQPDENFPYNWSIFRWIEGDIYNVHQFQDSTEAIEAMADFITALQMIDTAEGPLPGNGNNFRGVPLELRDVQTRSAIKEIASIYDTNLILKIWNDALNAPVWGDRPVWIHGDLHWGNILTQNGKITGIIDFGCLGIGDPANDVMSAWVLFSPASRKKFRAKIVFDDATWLRGCGWALSWAVIALPFYYPKKHLLADIAAYTLNNVVWDYKFRSL